MNGIVCYVNGNKMNHLFLVFIYSLKKFYGGDINVVFEGDQDDEVLEEVEKIPKLTVRIVGGNIISPSPYKGAANIWHKKALYHQHVYPFDNNLYYDIDHCFIKKFDEKIFYHIQNFKLISSCYNRPVLPEKKNRRRVAEVEKYFGIKLQNFLAVNGGCVGANKHCTELDYWLSLIPKMNVDGTQFKRNPEESALAITLSQGYGRSIEDNWSFSVQKNEYEFDTKDLIGIHFPRGRWKDCSIWKKMFDEVYNHNFMGVKKENKKVFLKDEYFIET